MRKTRVALKVNEIDDNVPIEVDVSGRKAIVIRQATPQEYIESMQRFRKQLLIGGNKYVLSRYIRRLSTPSISVRKIRNRAVKITK